MKALKFIGVSVIIAIVSVVTYIGYYGYFLSLDFKEKVIENESLVYKEMKGDYKNSKGVMDDVYQSLVTDCEVDSKRGFGIYFDKPGDVPTEQLRSEVGCIVEQDDLEKLAKLNPTYKRKTLNGKKAIVTTFPFKGPSSIFIGILKVYPQMEKVLKEKGIEEGFVIMEVYDVPNKKIEYRAVIQ